MSIYRISERRLINTDTYQEALNSALGLFPKETLSTGERRQIIIELLNLVNLGDENDQSAKDEAVRLTIRLLLSDPLTDQQAGAVARFLYQIRKLDFWPLEIPGNNRHFHLDSEEMVEIMAGDWRAINEIFTRFPERTGYWQKSLRKIETARSPRTVYRMLELHPDDIASIIQFGMVPEGLHRHTDLPSVIAAQQQQYFGQGNLPHPWGIERLAQHLYLGKSNLLTENWEEWETATPSPFKLGLATTTAKNIQHRGAAFFSSYIFEIILPANRLVAAPKDGLPEDERTIFFYIEPEAIKAVYHVEPISPLATWEQIRRQRPYSKPFLARFF